MAFLVRVLRQKTSLFQGTLTVWKCLPIAKGIGYGMVVVSFLVMIYYNLVIAYSFHYLFSGFQKILPWTRCDAWWNSPQTRAECLIINSGELSDNQLDCSIGQSTNNSILFWKENSTFQQDWIRVQHFEKIIKIFV